MKRTTLLFLLLLTLPAWAQTPQRIDVAVLISRLPKLPATTQQALLSAQQPNSYQAYGDEMQQLLRQIEQLNPISQRATQNAVTTDAKFKADGVDKMTDAQKIAYARQQNLGGAGSEGRLAFADRMKDPAFQKKFQAMSPQEKMALMQQQGVTASATMPQTSNPMQADMTAMMQDPAMREKWKAMNATERQAFIANYQKQKGYNSAKRSSGMAAGSAISSSGSFSDMLDDPKSAATASSPAVEALAKTRTLQTAITEAANVLKTLADQQQQQSDQRRADLQRALADALTSQQREGEAEAKRQGKPGKNWVWTNPPADRQRRITTAQQQQQADNETLAAATREWTTRQGALQPLVSAYRVAMTQIQYGESLFADDGQLPNVTILSSGQATIFSALKDITNSFDTIARHAAGSQLILADEQATTAGPRQLLQSDGG